MRSSYERYNFISSLLLVPLTLSHTCVQGTVRMVVFKVGVLEQTDADVSLDGGEVVVSSVSYRAPWSMH